MITHAFYIHSWFTWIGFLLISRHLGIPRTQTLFILARDFKVPDIYNDIISVRFEITEIQVLSLTTFDDKLSAVNHLFSKNGLNYPIRELFLPHIAYEPLAFLARCSHFTFLSFFQESIQMPSDLLVRRESDYLLQNSSHSLYHSTDPVLRSKISKRYYSFTNEILPLHLYNISIPGFEDLISSISSANNTFYDFAIIAGKAQNHSLGVQFFESIISTYQQFYPNSHILLKASPSSSSNLQQWMSSKVNESITFIPGDVSIESWIVNDRIGILFSELFSLSALALLYSHKTRLISLDKTILTDFPSYSDMITDRIKLYSYYQLSMSYLSLSQFLISHPGDTNG